MMESTQSIVSDAEVERIHANASFGSMSKRAVVDTAVVQYAFGYLSGHTMQCIAEEHGLIKRLRQKTCYPTLTKKGQRYLRAMFAGVRLDDILALRTLPLSNTEN